MAQKLHLVGNSEGDLLAFCLTPGKVDDRHPVPTPARRLFGTLFGDKGYVSQPLAEQLLVTQGLRLITKLRKQMHNRLLLLSGHVALRHGADIAWYWHLLPTRQIYTTLRLVRPSLATDLWLC